MKSVIWLRIASILTLVHAIAHTIGGVFGKPVPGAAAMVAAAMQNNYFTVYGLTRSYAGFYRGMGLGITISLTVEAVLLWQLAGLAKQHARLLRPLLAIMALGFLAFAVNSYLYFFQAPVVVEVLIAVCLGLAIVMAKPVESPLASPALAP